jgi:peptidoglycan/xylan/chitin deacetylase (PgdA/CDA1 family)
MRSEDPPPRVDERDPLERLLGLFVDAGKDSGHPRPGVEVVGGRSDLPIWLFDGEWQVFARAAGEVTSGVPSGAHEIAQFKLSGGEVLSASFDSARESVQLPFDPAEAYVNYLTEAWTGTAPRRGLSAGQLNAFYHVKRFVPRQLQIRSRQMLVRRQGLPSFPRWPIDTSVSRLVRFYAYCLLLARGQNEAEFRWFWPGRHRAAAILTHDVETADGLPLAVELADLEEDCGFRSSFNIGGWYEPDPGILRDLTTRGFEIGMHGLRHDRALFSSRAAFEAQRPGLAALASQLDAEGFRSPSTYRVFEWLGELPISYDGSIPHSDPFEPQPGGCCSLWPFFIGHVVELPYTLPQDYTLFSLLAHRSPALWIEQVDRIVAELGLIHALTHPDRGYLGDAVNRERYREFLLALAERDEIWKPLPRELANWWRLRDAAGAHDPQVGRGTIRIGETADEVELEPPSGAEALPGERRGLDAASPA